MILTVFNNRTGERIGEAEISSLENISQSSTTTLVLGQYDDHYYLKDGLVTRYTDEQYDRKKTGKEFHRWVNDRMGFVPFSEDLVWDIVRSRRDALLARSDWTTVSDNGLSVEKRAAWTMYRQALRDITQQPYTEIVWPKAP